MDSQPLSKVDHLRGHQALRENQFFKSILEYLDVEIETTLAVVSDNPVTAQDVPEHFRQLGKLAAMRQLRRMNDQVIAGLHEEVQAELNKEGQNA